MTSRLWSLLRYCPRPGHAPTTVPPPAQKNFRVKHAVIVQFLVQSKICDNLLSSLCISLSSELELKYATTPNKGGPASCCGIAATAGNNDAAVAAAVEAHTEGSSLQPASLSPLLVAVAVAAPTAALAVATTRHPRCQGCCRCRSKHQWCRNCRRRCHCHFHRPHRCRHYCHCHHSRPVTFSAVTFS